MFREHEERSSDRHRGGAAFSALADQSHDSQETEWGGRGRGRRHEFLARCRGLGVARPYAQACGRGGSSAMALGLHVPHTVTHGGWRWRSDKCWHTTISKALTKILRHEAIKLGIRIRSDGYCLLDQVLRADRLQELVVTSADVLCVAKNSDKKRFDVMVEGDDVFIRAAQGHSIKEVDDASLLQRLHLEDPDLPSQCVHGTYRSCVSSIIERGLLAGGTRRCGEFRNHIHFASAVPGDGRVISGMRYNCEVAIWVDLRGALRDGIPFYFSANRVILSPGRGGRLSNNYFLHARDLRSGEDLSLALRPQTRCLQALDTERDQGGVAGGVADRQLWRPLVALKAPWKHRPAPLKIQMAGDEEEYTRPGEYVYYWSICANRYTSLCRLH